MKKKLEAELMSMAHSILKMKNKSNVHELKVQAKQLYEKLSLLSFAEKHFEGTQPSIGKRDFIEAFYQEFESHQPLEKKKTPQPPTKEELNSETLEGETIVEASETSTQKIHAKKESEDLLENYDEIEETNSTQKDFNNLKDKVEVNTKENKPKETPTELQEKTPSEEIKETNETSKENKLDRQKEKAEHKEEDFGVHFDDLPLFEKASEDIDQPHQATQDTSVFETKADASTSDEVEQDEANLPYPKSEATEKKAPNPEETPTKPKTTADLFSQEKKSLNDQLKKGIKIGLNDRLAFTRQLFDGNVEDYNRVLSQLNTMQSFEDAKLFIEDAVKPEYKNWEGKENFESRFLSIVETRFEE